MPALITVRLTTCNSGSSYPTDSATLTIRERIHSLLSNYLQAQQINIKQFTMYVPLDMTSSHNRSTELPCSLRASFTVFISFSSVTTVLWVPTDGTIRQRIGQQVSGDGLTIMIDFYWVLQKASFLETSKK